ncbi:MAG: exosome complex RNA-binding protein Csl4 [Candidatus Bathyarchaeota archaeon]|nr:MAG: exosome complex RNA-binding protein Csl4 [Candidatus Bathyarchaeota archaeon]
MSKRKKEVFKTPGEKVAVIEEFVAGPGTFIEEGDIRSKTVGYTITDVHNKLVSIYPRSGTPIFPRKGSVIVGQVVNTQDKTAIIRILSVDNRPVPGQFTGIIHISTVSSNYVRSMYEAVRPGDLIKAKVISNRNGATHLSTLGRNLGVVQAFCIRCGNRLTRRGRILGCQVCSNIEERKITVDYGKEVGGLD